MKITLYSHRNVFNDGQEALHPGFRVETILFVLTNTLPRDTPFVKVEKSLIKSEHFRCKSEHAYLTVAYNQQAPRFNDKEGGSLEFTEDILLGMSFKFNVENIQDFSHS